MQTLTTTVNGLNLTYLSWGTGDRVVLCLHGFPDTPHTWDLLAPVLVDAGFRVVAPYMRGYPPSDAPADGDYASNALAADAVGLLDALNVERAWLVGHDWGASAAYAATALAPARWQRLVTLAIPHPRALKFDLQTLVMARHFITFQRRSASVAWLRRDNFKALETLYRRWSPNWSFGDADLAPIRHALGQPGGVEGALGYYWSFVAGRRNRDPDQPSLTGRRTVVPTLGLFGEADGALPASALARTHDAFKADYEQVVLPDVGHFLHREAPEAVNSHIVRFLTQG